jgi:enamine deaminase RidA (YjgF/YER057c/UK114 family)
MGVRHQLKRCRDDRRLVTIDRSIKRAAETTGFVVAVGARWVLLEATRDRGYPDGFIAVRIADINDIRREPVFEDFARSQCSAAAPHGIELDTTNGLLRSLGQQFPLVGIERERKLRDGRWIGVFLEARGGWVHLREIRPDASWDKHSSGYRTKSVTLVAAGDDYARALLRIAHAASAGPRAAESRQRISQGSPFEETIGYSRAVAEGPWVWVSGTTGFAYASMTISDDVVEQASQALRNIAWALGQAGASLADVVRVRYLLPDADDFEPCWPVLREAFSDAPPAATMQVCGLADPAMKIEIDVTAYRAEANRRTASGGVHR